MSRSKQSGRSGVIGILLFLLVIAGGLVGLFSFLSGIGDGSWPLGIEKNEVQAYRSIFDLSTDTPDSTLRVTSIDLVKLEGDTTRTLSATHPSPRWMHAIMQTADAGIDTVRIRRLRSTDGAYLLKLPKSSTQRLERQTVLIPANVHSMKTKYAEVMAQELGLVAPELSFVQLNINGEDQGVFIREARITQQLLEKKRLSDAVHFEHGFSTYDPVHTAPDINDSATEAVVREKLRLLNEMAQAGQFSSMQHHLEKREAMALLLMLWSEQRLDYCYTKDHTHTTVQQDV